MMSKLNKSQSQLPAVGNGVETVRPAAPPRHLSHEGIQEFHFLI